MKKKNETLVAYHKGNREAEFECMGPGFHSMNKIHKSVKTYSRKDKHKMSFV